MARALIVGCGCRGQELARTLIAEGHLVRGTTRVAGGRSAAIEAAGAEAAIADPYRLATVTPLLAGVSVVVWLMGSATGSTDQVEAVHGTRLESLLAKLVDSGVRGLVYEAGGSAPAELLAAGSEQVRRAGEWFRMPVQMVQADPDDTAVWLAAMRDAVGAVLSA